MSYFNQTSQWSNFWQQANPIRHRVVALAVNDLQVYAYEYPLFGNYRFWYLPRVPIYDQKLVSKSDLAQLLEKIIQSARQQKIVFIKSDWDSEFCSKFETNQSQSWLQLLQNLIPKTKIIFSPKKLQYLSTKVILTKDLIEQPVETFDPQEFWNQNKVYFEQNMDKRTRYGTRKSLEQGWKVIATKTQSGFQDFYGLHSSTAVRQHFGIHDTSYLELLWKQDFSHAILLQDQQGQTQSVWLGILLNGSLVNLYGGNSLLSRELHGQYLIHLAALNMSKTMGAATYDLGGMESGKGFDLFKQGYKGQMIEFQGPFDMILKPFIYSLYINLVKLRSWIKK